LSPQAGDFACVHTRGNTGTLITVAEYMNGSASSWYDHACVYVGQPDKNAPYGYVMGAQPRGARLSPLRHAQVTGEDRNWIWSTGRIAAMTDAQYQLIIRNALACKGIGYSAADYFALAARRFHVPVPGLKDYIASSGRLICSQLVDWCYAQAGVRLFTDGRWPGYVTPADLAGLIGA